MQDLGGFSCTSCGGKAINALGQIAGRTRFTADGFKHAFRWTAAGGLQDLGTLGGQFSDALAINARGQIAGSASTADGSLHAFLWTP